MIFLFQVILCFSLAVFKFFWSYRNEKNYRDHIPSDESPLISALIGLGTLFVLTNSMIPISLIISLEMVKMAQAYFISNDEDMYSEENDRYSKVFTSSLNEELGQIQFIFSDKTGTLTCNKMEFKICVVGDEIYGDTSCLRNGFLSLHTSQIEDKAYHIPTDQTKPSSHEFYEPRFENL